jgi:hypothetical protein
LERANSELTNSLDENSRVRGFLAQILEGLPCGVLVLDAGQRLRVINPEARRLLMLDPSWLPEQGGGVAGGDRSAPGGIFLQKYRCGKRMVLRRSRRHSRSRNCAGAGGRERRRGKRNDLDFARTSIDVPADQLDRVRVEMASQSLPHRERMGFELFDKPNWSSSDFSERMC